MDRDLFLAILAMDSCNRGYGAGLAGLAPSGQIGNATILTDAAAELGDSIIQAAGFYAVAYDVSGVAGNCHSSQRNFASTATLS